RLLTMRLPAFAAALSGALAIALGAAARPPRVEVQEVAETGIMPKGASISPDGKRFYVTNFGQENLRNITVYDAETLKLIDTINVPGIVVESVLSPDGTTIYASNFERGTVQFVDVETKKIRTEVKTGSHPKVIVLSRDGDMLYAAN